MRFYVHVPEVHTTTFEVLADSEEKAIDIVRRALQGEPREAILHEYSAEYSHTMGSDLWGTELVRQSPAEQLADIPPEPGADAPMESA